MKTLNIQSLYFEYKIRNIQANSDNSEDKSNSEDQVNQCTNI